MVQLLDSDIKTHDVLDWKGIHLIHYMGSSCSQKVRIFLNLKGIDWEWHTIDLLANENVEALVFGHQSSWIGFSAGTQWRGAHRKQRYNPISGKDVPRALPHTCRS